MPTLGNALDFSKYEGRNFRAHILGTAPSSPVTGQLYFNSADNTLYWWDGTQWVPAKAGSGTPVGPAGGDLSGTYPNPQLAAGVVVDADVSGTAAIAETKLSLASDAAVGTPSRRSIGTGALQAMAGNTRLDTIAIPTGPINLNSQRLTAVADPTAATDGANKQYVDTTTQGLDAKLSVRAATTGTIALSGSQTIDGVACVIGDRILVKDQSTAAQNGLYVVAAGAWTRTTDADTWNELVSAYVWVEEGTANADSGYVCTVNQGGTLGTTNVTWTQFSGAGQITSGAGLTKTGNTLDVGQGTGITVAADTVSIDSTIVPRYYSSATHAAAATWTITQATHGCRATRGLIVQCQVEATGAVVLPDITVAANGDVTVTFGASQTANTIRTTVIG